MIEDEDEVTHIAASIRQEMPKIISTSAERSFFILLFFKIYPPNAVYKCEAKSHTFS